MTRRNGCANVLTGDNIMTKFAFTESRNVAEFVPADFFAANSISAAKRYATKNRIFRGTVLKLFAVLDSGAMCLLSTKEGNVWSDFDADSAEIDADLAESMFSKPDNFWLYR